jgi:hypothetical protein
MATKPVQQNNAGAPLRDGYLWIVKKPFAMIKLLYVLRMALAQSPRSESARMQAENSKLFRLFDPVEPGMNP